jgi:c(7)-type cytochrome triheme protein
MLGSLRLSFFCVALLCLPMATVSGADLEFSHKLHLGKVGLNCTFCHSSAEASATVTDDNLPAAQLCLACHNGQTAPTVDVSPLEAHTPAERGFRFSHQQHLALGNPAPRIAEAIDSGKYLGHVGDIRPQLETESSCAACHRGLRQADQVDSKAHLPRMSDCLVCHDKIDNPFSCETCHARDFAIKPASHTANFIDQHSTGKMGFDKLTCQPCHGRSFTCMGCH